MQQRLCKKSPRERFGRGDEIRHAALAHDAAAACARTRPQVDQVIRAPDRVLVVLDHQQRVALGAQFLERIKKHTIVTRMKADGRLVEHVADTLQVRAELCGEPDPLRLASRERRRRPVQRDVAEPDVLQEREP